MGPRKMMALNGTYENGHIVLESTVKSDKPLKVIVTFLDPDVEITNGETKKEMSFSFAQSRKLLANYKGSFSETVIKERREAI